VRIIILIDVILLMMFLPSQHIDDPILFVMTECINNVLQSPSSDLFFIRNYFHIDTFVRLLFSKDQRPNSWT
jgi:hypothetical protein